MCLKNKIKHICKEIVLFRKLYLQGRERNIFMTNSWLLFPLYFPPSPPLSCFFLGVGGEGLIYFWWGSFLCFFFFALMGCFGVGTLQTVLQCLFLVSLFYASKYLCLYMCLCGSGKWKMQNKLCISTY